LNSSVVKYSCFKRWTQYYARLKFFAFCNLTDQKRSRKKLMNTRTNLVAALCLLFLTLSCEKDEETIPTASSPVNDELPTGSVSGNQDLPPSIILMDIPAGTFTMGGTTKTADAPTVSVTVTAFKVSEKEITNQQYATFLNNAYLDGWITVSAQSTSDPCGTVTENMVIGAGDAPNAGEVFLQLGETGGCTSGGEAEHIDNKSWLSFNTSNSTFELLDDTKAEWPVNWVKWFGAYAFVQYYDVSLPSEAQWESAARGGQQLEYPTDDGTLSSSKANYNGDDPGFYNPDGHSVEAGTYAPNAYGIYDMGGNVWEWCQDYYGDSFYTDGTTDPINTTAGTDAKRVRRGGSWNYHAATLLTYARASDFENRGNNHFGFRIVID
jgi:sulfatase modifying factor 1